MNVVEMYLIYRRYYGLFAINVFAPGLYYRDTIYLLKYHACGLPTHHFFSNILVLIVS